MSTTLYKGSIILKFVMDDPLWYSITNILPSYYYNLKSDWVHSLVDPDMLKIILEDNVPTTDMITVPASKLITGAERHTSAGTFATPLKSGQSNTLKAIAGGKDRNGTVHVGSRLAIAAIDLSINGTNSTAYLYYAGTAKAPTILHFELVPKFGPQNNLNYITFPKNTIGNEKLNSTEEPYNVITVGTQTFKYTTPNILTSFNVAMQILTNFSVGTSLIEIKRLLNEQIKSGYVRNWAQFAVNFAMTNAGNGTNTTLKTISDKEVFANKIAE